MTCMQEEENFLRASAQRRKRIVGLLIHDLLV